MSVLDKKYVLKVDTKSTFFNPTLQFSISDNETSDMLIRVTNDNKLIYMKDIIAVMVVIDPNNMIHSDFVEVEKAEEGLLYCNLSNNLKNIDGTWKARLMCIYGEERIVTSTFSYKVNVDEFVQLNKEVVTDDRFGTLTEMLSRLSSIEFQENSRIEAETNRVEAEKQREIAKQQLIDRVNKLIADTNLKVEENLSEQNKKVDDNLLENSNKVTKLISDTTTKIDSYKTEKDEAIQQDLQLYKQETTKSIDDYKNAKDIQINQDLEKYKSDTTTDIDTYKNNKNAEINQYKTEKDLEIDTYVANKNKELDRYVAAKNNDIDNYKKAKDLLIDDKLKEVDASEKSRAEAETLRQEQHTEREAFLNGFESRVNANEAKNTEQDGRLNSVEYISKRQDVALSGLLNESGDKRLAIEGEGNHLKLEHSKEGVVEVGKVVGNTMVNLYKNITKISNAAGAIIYSKDEGLDYNLFKPNTVYTFIPYDTTNKTDIYSLCDLSGGNQYFNGLKTISTFTTPTDLGTNIKRKIFAYSHEATPYVTEDVNKIKYVILEGDYTSKPIPSECFEGMKSTFEDCLVTQEMIDAGTEKAENLGKYKGELKVVGKNKFHYNIPSHYINVEKLSNGYKLILSPEDAVKGKSFYTERVSIKKHTKYIISAKICLSRSTIEPDTVGANIDIVNGATRTWIYGSALATTKGVTNIKNRFNSGNCDSIRLQFFVRAKISGEVRFIDIQIEEDPQPDMPTTPSPYEPYKESKQTLYLDEPLYKDNELCIHNGQLGYWKNCERTVFNGSDDENWRISGANNDDYTTLFFINDGISKISNSAISDKFRVITSYTAGNPEGIKGDNLDINIRISNSKATDLVSFKQWLQVNPTTVMYELAEPIFVPILENTPQWILNCFNECTLSIDSNITATSMSATYSGNVVSVVALDKIQYEQDKVAIENAYKLSVLGIMTGVTI